ncbi:hypothetical protein EGW08_014106 [Elysia chlorotica]|uniref:SAM domain-containing protein n=1 Tax=Elysia chlorotica TaxID=188477 RepID=A0A433T954_ELYCH|nr:hypothetical protein EGW08_014106 [Elysia chlorotica]
MSDNVVRREIQRRDDPFGIPACFYWTVDEVADWVDSIGYGKYKENFRSHFINGRKLLTVDACVLPRMGITHFGDILCLCKHIREVLGIRRHVRDYNPWQLRSNYISVVPTSGKKQPHLSFREHAKNVERIAEARLQYFKRKHYCYARWTMEPGWDKHIKTESTLENAPQERVLKSMQDRLRAAASKLLSYEEERSMWVHKPDIPTKAQLDRFRYPKLKKPSGLTEKSLSVIGQVNWSPVRNITYCNEQSQQKSKNKGAVSMTENTEIKETDGGPLNNLKLDNVKEGNKDNATTKEVNTVDAGDKKPSAQDKTKAKKKPKVAKAINDNVSTSAPAYNVSIIFHWRKMESSKGYPPLRLDQLVYCGYYNEQQRQAA